jgi:hypothetical protein
MPDVESPFFQVAQTTYSTSQGGLALPLFYFEASNLTAFFLANREAATARLRGTGLRLAVTAGGRAPVGLVHCEYKRTSVDAYHEVALVLPVLPEGAPPLRNPLQALYGSVEDRNFGFHTLDLPVTTSVADSCSRELWGFPTFVTEIPFHLDRKSFQSTVRDPDGHEDILWMSGRLLPGAPVPPMSLVLYTHLDGELLRCTVNVRGWMTLRPAHNLRLHVGESTHRMAQHLREFGLDGARPVIVMDTHRFQSRFNAGMPVGKRVKPQASDVGAFEVQPQG